MKNCSLDLLTYDWQTMSIPSKASFNMKTRLMCISCYNIFDGSSKNVSIMGQSSSKWGSIIKRISKRRNDFIIADDSKRKKKKCNLHLQYFFNTYG